MIQPIKVDIDKESSIKVVKKLGYRFVVHGNEKLLHGRPFWDQVNDGLWEPETFRIIEKYAEPSRAFIDIGAWIGPTTLFGACVAGKVFSVEPDPVAISALKDNIALNAALATKIRLFEGCIANVSGPVSIGNPKGFGNTLSSLLYKNENRQHSTEGLNFSDFVSTFDIENCSLIKMDIEGAEMLVLPTMIDYLVQYKPSLFLSIHRPMYGERCYEVSEMIFDILSSIYTYILNSDGQPITDINDVRMFNFELIATCNI